MSSNHETPSAELAAAAVRVLLEYVGEDPERPGLQDTPQRVLRAWRCDWGAGYADDAKNLVKLFLQEETKSSLPYDEMILIKDISYHSHCEHHLAPFFGVAHVAYIPSPERCQSLIGLSKMARVVDHFSRRLQVQERLTGQIAEFLTDHLSYDVGVLLEGTHLCMASRGVRQPYSKTTTLVLRGAFKSVPQRRDEFLRLIGH